MRFLVLGPLEARADGRAVALGGVKQRAVLAVLILHANEAVSAERLALALWGEDAPPGSVANVQVHVSRLRKALGNPELPATTPAGYRLRVDPGELDLERFEARVEDGRAALSAAQPEEAASILREALDLWRGPPLAELASLPFAPAAIARLEEQRLAAVELRVDADLAAGRHAELAAELQHATLEHPWRERLHAQRMLALYRSGRQAEALDAYRQAREALVDELGIEPGPELAELQRAILAHDARLDPPRRPADAARDPLSSLPAPPNRTIGRDREIADVAARAVDRSVRLVTLTGPGGVGKTRLALEAARAVEPELSDGARLVSLAAVQRHQHVPAAIATALGITMLASETPEQAVERFLEGKQLLLVLDNCEHVLDAAPFVGRLLASCPRVTVLATSREPLALQAETRVPVPPLAVTGAGEGAVALFAERARAHDPAVDLGDDGVTEICRRLDGLPLAIELAAARCALLSPAEIAHHLDGALAALGSGTRDAPARQQTLRATIDWSHDLLADEEQACFARLAVFAGGATVESAQAIAGASMEMLDRLVAKSLLVRRRGRDGRTRLTMLETIRAYAAERLAAARDHETIRERHAGHHLELARRHGSERALWGSRRHEHLAELDAESENLQAALRWTLERRRAEPALALCSALGRYWLLRGRYAEAMESIDAALRLPGADAHPALRADVLLRKTWALFPLGRAGERLELLDEAQAVARELGDPRVLSQVLQTRSVAITEADGPPEVADALAEESLRWATAAGDEWAAAMAAVAGARSATSDVELHERVERAASRLREVGSAYILAYLLSFAAYKSLCLARDAEAREFVGRAIAVAAELGDPALTMQLHGEIGLVELLSGDPGTARRAFAEETALCRELVYLPFALECLSGLAAVAVHDGDLDRAARLCGAAGAHRYDPGDDAIHARLEATFFAPARGRHGPGAWDTAEREGAALGFDDALAYALGEPRRRAAGVSGPGPSTGGRRAPAR